VSLAPFVVWAPLPGSVTLKIKKVGAAEASDIPMKRDDEGWWHPAVPLPDGLSEEGGAEEFGADGNEDGAAPGIFRDIGGQLAGEAAH